ncbi:MAG: hypothetical protein Q9162_001384 [Coniocarpon cinnabarinum]
MQTLKMWDPELVPLFPPTTNYFCYFDPRDGRTILEAEKRLLRIAKDQGPFDGAMGFSQGCCLLTGIMEKYRDQLSFRFAVFHCGIRPFKVDEPNEDGSFSSGGSLPQAYEKAESSVAGYIPTLHIPGGGKDRWFEESKLLHDLWKSHDADAHPARYWSHTEGHRLPRSQVANRKIANLFAGLIEEAMMG